MSRGRGDRSTHVRAQRVDGAVADTVPEILAVQLDGQVDGQSAAAAQSHRRRPHLLRQLQRTGDVRLPLETTAADGSDQTPPLAAAAANWRRPTAAGDKQQQTGQIRRHLLRQLQRTGDVRLPLETTAADGSDQTPPPAAAAANWRRPTAAGDNSSRRVRSGTPPPAAAAAKLETSDCSWRQQQQDGSDQTPPPAAAAANWRRPTAAGDNSSRRVRSDATSCGSCSELETSDCSWRQQQQTGQIRRHLLQQLQRTGDVRLQLETTAADE